MDETSAERNKARLRAALRANLRKRRAPRLAEPQPPAAAVPRQPDTPAQE
jgi:hypothetical protein